MTDAIDQLATALAAAQSKMGNAAFNQTNPHFKSQYANLAAIRDATIPHLAANGLALVQFTTIHATETGIGLILRTRLIHKSGQFIEGEYPIGAGTPQQMGSAMTYAKRYSWSAMCGIAADADDDGNAAEGLQVKAGVAPKPKAAARKDFEKVETAFRAAKTEDELRQANADNSAIIASLPDDWKDSARKEYARCLTKLRLEDEIPEEGGTVDEPITESEKMLTA